MKILKFSLPSSRGEYTTELPVGSKVLSVGKQAEQLRVWAACPNTTEYAERTFRMLHTGEEVPTDSKFLGTVHLHESSYILHVFEINRKEDE